MLAAFRKDLRLLLADRSALFLTLVAPLVMITIITVARRDSAEPYRPTLLVVDEDNGPLRRRSWSGWPPNVPTSSPRTRRVPRTWCAT
jgi:hypothetical protein